MPRSERESRVGAYTEEPAERRKRLRNLLVLILLISIGLHIVAGIGAGIWVIARYFTQPRTQFVVQKKAQMKAEDREHMAQMDSMASLRPKPVFNNRIQSLRPSKLAMPELPRVPLETITPLDTEALISDQVDGIGKYGQGEGSGSGSGEGNGGFFGGKGAAGSGLLAGNFYDLKKDSKGKDTIMAKEIETRGNAIIIDPVTSGAYYDVCNRLSRSSSTESVLGKYYKAPDTLYLAQVAIPQIAADNAPREFGVGDKVKPRYWLAVYKGRATAPETGNYKFLGRADDVLLVKVNNRLVFDGSIGNSSRLHGKGGSTFRAEEGKAYDIEVIIGECPGASFEAWLQIQKDGEDPYWFRMNDRPVEYSGGGPTQKINGPIWYPAAKKSGIGIGF